MYQEDFEPGTAVYNGDVVSTNNINYIAVLNPYCNCPKLSTAFKVKKIAPLIYQFGDPAKNIDRYIWKFGDGVTSSQKSPIHTYKSSGTYKVCLQEMSRLLEGIAL
jgi:PKD repeat protein